MSSMHFRGGISPRDASSSEWWEAVTPSDSDDLPWLTRGLYIGGDGDVAAVRSDGTAVTFKGLVAGSVLPINARRVNSTNTSATNIVALY